MEENLRQHDQADDQTLPPSGTTRLSATVCDSQNLHAELSSPSPAPSQEFSKRTETSIKDLNAKIESFIDSKNALLQQFNQETTSLNNKHEQRLLSERQKHKLCEENFKRDIENANAKYKELEDKRAADLRALRDQVDKIANELAETKKSAETTKQDLEIDIAFKDKKIQNLETEKVKLVNNSTLKAEEFKNQRVKLENQLKEFKALQEEDVLKIEQLEKNLGTSNDEVSQLKNELCDLGDKYSESQNSYRELNDELNKINAELKASENVKQEKIKVIHSLTSTLTESKIEIGQLRKNVAELEASRLSEVKELQAQLINQNALNEKELDDLKVEKTRTERRLREENVKLEERINVALSESAHLKSSLDQKVKNFTREYEVFQAKIVRLEEHAKERESKLAEANLNNEQSLKELNNVKSLLVDARRELEKQKVELAVSIETASDLNIKYSMAQTEIDDLKEDLEKAKTYHQDRNKQIENLKVSLSSSQTECDELKTLNDKLQRSLRDLNEQLGSMENERSELRNTLADVENSRHEIKTKLDSSKISCLELDHKLKMAEDEVSRFNREIESSNNKRKMQAEELEMAGKSLEKMKQLYGKMHEQNKELQMKNSKLESKKLEIERMYKSPAYSEKDFEIRHLKREIEELSERISILEREKRRIEQKYANLERDYSAVASRSTSRPPASVNQLRTPSPATTEPRPQSDHSSSVLSITRHLKDTSLLNSTMKSNAEMHFSKVTRGIEALEQNHLELQQKVLGLENWIESVSSESDLNSTKRSEDLSGFRIAETASVKSSNAEALDCNGNYNDADEKLKIAQLKAQTLIESSSMFEKEISDLRSIRSRSQSLRRYNLNKREAESDQEELGA